MHLKGKKEEPDTGKSFDDHWVLKVAVFVGNWREIHQYKK